MIDTVVSPPESDDKSVFAYLVKDVRLVSLHDPATEKIDLGI